MEQKLSTTNERNKEGKQRKKIAGGHEIYSTRIKGKNMRGEESHKNVKVTQNKTPIEKYFMLDLCMDICINTTLSCDSLFSLQ